MAFSKARWENLATVNEDLRSLSSKIEMVVPASLARRLAREWQTKSKQCKYLISFSCGVISSNSTIFSSSPTSSNLSCSLPRGGGSAVVGREWLGEEGLESSSFGEEESRTRSEGRTCGEGFALEDSSFVGSGCFRSLSWRRRA